MPINVREFANARKRAQTVTMRVIASRRSTTPRVLSMAAQAQIGRKASAGRHDAEITRAATSSRTFRWAKDYGMFDASTIGAVVFHGDVMNTAARLEQATRDLDRRFLASADALSRLTRTERYALELLGPQTLRGRAAPIDVYAVEALAG